MEKKKKLYFAINICIIILLMLVRTMLASISDLRIIDIISKCDTENAQDTNINITRQITESTDRELTFQTRIKNIQRNMVDGGDVGEGAVTEHTEVVIAIDNSFSMRSTNDSKRLEIAKNVAKKIVSALSSNKNVEFGLVTSSDGKIVSMGQFLDEAIEKINLVELSERKNISRDMLQEVERFYSENTNNKYAYILTDGGDAVEEQLENMEANGIKITTILTDITSQSYEILNNEEVKKTYNYDEFLMNTGTIFKEILGEQENGIEVAILIDNSKNIATNEDFQEIKEISQKLVSELYTSVKNLKMSLYNSRGEIKVMGATEESITTAISQMERNRKHANR